MAQPVSRFTMREHQRAIYRDPSRFKVPVMHRRAGKSVLFCGQLMAACTQGKDGQQFHYVGPSIKQTKAIAWQYVQKMAQTCGNCKINQSDLKVTFPVGSTLELLGVENIDTLRGRYSNGIVLDEAQLMPQSHWAYVLRPLLADRKGWSVIGGTPAGWHNLLGWAYKHAPQSDNWANFMYRVTETDALDPQEVADMRQEMSTEAFNQEMLCDFNAAVQGAYYAKQMQAMQDEKRLTLARYDNELPVIAALDLGHDDLMPVLFAQEVGSELRVFHVECYRFTSIPDMLDHWRKELSFPIDLCILPHDARVRDLTSGTTREQAFQSRGYNTTIAPKLSLIEGIEQSRRQLAHTWIDSDGASMLYEALCMYRSDMDETTGVTKLTPVHDWASHWADAFRYLATGDRSIFNNWGERDLRGLAVT